MEFVKITFKDGTILRVGLSSTKSIDFTEAQVKYDAEKGETEVSCPTADSMESEVLYIDGEISSITPDSEGDGPLCPEICLDSPSISVPSEILTDSDAVTLDKEVPVEQSEKPVEQSVESSIDEIVNLVMDSPDVPVVKETPVDVPVPAEQSEKPVEQSEEPVSEKDSVSTEFVGA